MRWGFGAASERCEARTGRRRARRVLAALYRIGWQLKREAGSHKTLARDGWPDFVFASTRVMRSALG